MPMLELWPNCSPYSDRLGAFGRNQHGQHRRSTANISRNRHECFRNRLMLFRQSLKPRADIVETIDFPQDLCKRHRQTAHSLKSLRWANFRWTGLGSEDLKEEKVETAPIPTIAGYTEVRVIQIDRLRVPHFSRVLCARSGDFRQPKSAWGIRLFDSTELTTQTETD